MHRFYRRFAPALLGMLLAAPWMAASARDDLAGSQQAWRIREGEQRVRAGEQRMLAAWAQVQPEIARREEEQRQRLRQASQRELQRADMDRLRQAWEAAHPWPWKPPA